MASSCLFFGSNWDLTCDRCGTLSSEPIRENKSNSCEECRLIPVFKVLDVELMSKPFDRPIGGLVCSHAATKKKKAFGHVTRQVPSLIQHVGQILFVQYDRVQTADSSMLKTSHRAKAVISDTGRAV